MHKAQKHLPIIVICLSLLTCGVFAGDLNSPAAPSDPASAMYILEDLYNRLATGTAGAKRSGVFAEPVTGPGSTMHNLNDIMGKAPAVDAAAALPGEILIGKKYWGLTAGQWGLQTGTMSSVGEMNITPGTTTQIISNGFHNGNGRVAGDANLVSGNIKAGISIFGVNGDTNVVNTTSGDATTGELMSGKKAWVDGTEVTGTLATKTLSAATATVEAGYYTSTTLSTIDTDLTFSNIKAGTTIFGITGNPAVVDTSAGNATTGEILLGRQAWVNGSLATGTRCGGTVLKAGGSFSTGGRWYDNNDGTITDTDTGLIWIKNASNTQRYYAASATTDTTWFVYSLQNGTSGLSDGSTNGDWRLPSAKELNSLKTGTEPVSSSSIPTTSFGPIFTHSLSGLYFWSSTNYSTSIFETMVLSIAFDGASSTPRTKADSASTACVWAVRCKL